jgi:glycosyltransferase involved in cell wall biosynthesis
MKSGPRVFLGLENIAGIFTSLKKGFNELGIDADYYSITPHMFSYKTDKIIKYSPSPVVRKLQKFFLMLKMALRYDYFIFDSEGTLLPDFKDVRLFKKFGKKCVVVFTGCDVRMPEHVAGFKWNCCLECNDAYKVHVGCFLETKPAKTKKIEANFDLIVCPEEAAGDLSKKYFNILFPVDANKFTVTPPETQKRKLRILHAPSSEVYKGTHHIIPVIESLKQKYDFDFKKIQEVSIDELYKEVQQADLLIDQMLVGFYGVLSTEAMAMGKPVICYIRPDIWEKIKDDCPVINADPDTLEQTLENILKNPEMLKEIGIKSRKYVEKYHDAKVIAKQYLEILQA